MPGETSEGPQFPLFATQVKQGILPEAAQEKPKSFLLLAD